MFFKTLIFFTFVHACLCKFEAEDEAESFRATYLTSTRDVALITKRDVEKMRGNVGNNKRDSKSHLFTIISELDAFEASSGPKSMIPLLYIRDLAKEYTENKKKKSETKIEAMRGITSNIDEFAQTQCRYLSPETLFHPISDDFRITASEKNSAVKYEEFIAKESKKSRSSTWKLNRAYEKATTAGEKLHILHKVYLKSVSKSEENPENQYFRNLRAAIQETIRSDYQKSFCEMFGFSDEVVEKQNYEKALKLIEKYGSAKKILFDYLINLVNSESRPKRSANLVKILAKFIAKCKSLDVKSSPEISKKIDADIQLIAKTIDAIDDKKTKTVVTSSPTNSAGMFFEKYLATYTSFNAENSKIDPTDQTSAIQYLISLLRTESRLAEEFDALDLSHSFLFYTSEFFTAFRANTHVALMEQAETVSKTLNSLEENMQLKAEEAETNAKAALDAYSNSVDSQEKLWFGDVLTSTLEFKLAVDEWKSESAISDGSFLTSAILDKYSKVAEETLLLRIREASDGVLETDVYMNSVVSLIIFANNPSAKKRAGRLVAKASLGNLKSFKFYLGVINKIETASSPFIQQIYSAAAHRLEGYYVEHSTCNAKVMDMVHQSKWIQPAEKEKISLLFNANCGKTKESALELLQMKLRSGNARVFSVFLHNYAFDYHIASKGTTKEEIASSEFLTVWREWCESIKNTYDTYFRYVGDDGVLKDESTLFDTDEWSRLIEGIARGIGMVVDSGSDDREASLTMLWTKVHAYIENYRISNKPGKQGLPLHFPVQFLTSALGLKNDLKRDVDVLAKDVVKKLSPAKQSPVVERKRKEEKKGRFSGFLSRFQRGKKVQ